MSPVRTLVAGKRLTFFAMLDYHLWLSFAG